jgi:carbonic anhydrase
MEDLDELGRGVAKFRSKVFPTRRALFERLANSQEPKALFLTCADSRIIPSLITQTGPGELFIERNPGNIVPVYSDIAVGVSASIEYAIAALGAKHVIVCGHSDCGAVRGMMQPEKLAGMSAVGRWLSYGAEAASRLSCDGGDPSDEARLQRLTRLNVIVQIEHLQSHPSVRAAQDRGELHIHGWVYDIATGGVEAYDPQTGAFRAFPMAPVMSI